MPLNSNIKKDKALSSALFHKNIKLKHLKRAYDSNKIRIPLLWRKIQFKGYPRFEQITLPEPNLSNITLKESIIKRESLEDCLSKSISLQGVSNVLYYSAGIIRSGIKLDEDSRRCYPSAGARYPLEVYTICLRIKKCKQGIYHYNVKNYSLERLPNISDLKKQLLKSVDRPEIIKKCPIIIIITAVFPRTQIKYGERGYIYVFLDAGHLAQNICLMSTAIGLQARPVGGFIENDINVLLDLNIKQERAIYLLLIGQPL